MKPWLHRSHCTVALPLPSGKAFTLPGKKSCSSQIVTQQLTISIFVNSTRQALWWTHPNVFITLYELWVSKETSLQYRFHQSKIHHIQKEEAQNRQVYDDCNLHNASTVYARIVTWPPQSLSRQQGPREEYIKIVKSLLIFGSATRWLKTHEQRKEKPKHSLVLEGFGAHRCYLGTVSLSEALLKTLR